MVLLVALAALVAMAAAVVPPGMRGLIGGKATVTVHIEKSRMGGKVSAAVAAAAADTANLQGTQAKVAVLA